MLKERLLDKAIKKVYNEIKGEGQVIFIPTVITVNNNSKIGTISSTSGNIMSEYNELVDEEKNKDILNMSSRELLERISELLPVHAILDVVVKRIDDETLERIYAEILNELEGEE